MPASNMFVAKFTLGAWILSLCFIAANVAADGPTATDGTKTQSTVTLRQLLNVAVRRSPEIALAQVDVAIAEAGLTQARGVDDWRLHASTETSTTRNPTVRGQPFQTIAEDSVGFASGIQRSLSSGGSVGIEVQGSYKKQEFAVLDEDEDTIDFDTATAAGSVAATFSQPLLRGRGAKAARADKRRAAASRSVSQLARDATTTQLVLDIATGYWDLVASTRRRIILLGSVTLAKRQLQITKAAIAGKVAAPVDALAVEQALAVREEAVLLAEVDISEKSLALRQLVGLEIGPGQVELYPEEQPTFTARTINVTDMLHRAHAQNPQLLLIRKRGAIAKIDVDATDTQTRPQLDLFVRAGPSGSANAVDDALRQIGRFDGYSVSASLRYQQSIGNRSARGAHKSAVGKLRRHQLSVVTAERATAAAVVHATNQIRASQKRLQVSTRSIRLAEKNLKSEKIRFSAGRATNFDVLRRQDELEQAKLSRVEAIVAHQKALLNLSSLTGTLIKEQNVSQNASPMRK